MAEASDESLEYDIKNDLEYISKLLALDESKIQSVINTFNTTGANVTYSKIGQLTGFDPGTDGLNIRDALAYIVHFYNSHSKLFESELSRSNIDDRVRQQLKTFLERLNKEALDGLELIYSSIQNEEKPTLLSVKDKLLLTEILDDNDKQVGYLPLMRLTFEFLDEDDDEMQQSFYMPLDNFNALMESLKKIQVKAIQSAKEYRNKLGDSVVLIGD